MSASLGKPDRSPPPPPPSPFPCAMFSTRQRGLPTNIPLRDLSPSLGSTDSTDWKLLSATPTRERISYRKTSNSNESLRILREKGIAILFTSFPKYFHARIEIYSCNSDRKICTELSINLSSERISTRILRDRHQIVAVSANFLTPAHLNVPFKVSSGRLVFARRLLRVISRLAKTLRFELVVREICLGILFAANRF